jgi:transcriptional regulator with XRE-family HTH domain
MGTLGEYLRKAREAKDIDIRDAAQQTRISINYLKALEEENFAKLPGDVFVKGFLKSYGKFLKLDEAEMLMRFADLKPKAIAPAPVPAAETATPTADSGSQRKTLVEPFLWAAAICVSLLVFLFSSMPSRHAGKTPQPDDLASSPLFSAGTDTAQASPVRSEKLYLELVAMEDTWLLVRTDTSPQKKAVLKKGESLIWSAEDRFLLSYGGVGAMKLFLNGEELIVKGTSETPVRDLAISRSGILNQPVAVKQPVPARPKPKVPVVPVQHPAPAPAPDAAQSEAVSVPASQAAPSPEPVPAPAPGSAPAAPAPIPVPAPAQ